MDNKNEKLSQYFEKGVSIFNKCKTLASEKGGKIVSKMKENMETKAAAQQNKKSEEWRQPKSSENKNAPSSGKENTAQIYEGSIEPGKSGLHKMEMTKENMESYGRDLSVSSMVYGILALWASMLSSMWFLSIIPIILALLGRSNGKKAKKLLPPEQSMVAASGSTISLIALIISIILGAISLFLFSASVYTINYLFSIFR